MEFLTIHEFFKLFKITSSRNNAKSMEIKFQSSILAVLFIVIFILTPTLILAGEEITASTDLTLNATTRPELKLGLTQSFTFPFLRGMSPLTSGNNIKAAITGEVTPISLMGIGELSWTPIAFLQFMTGGSLGSGWNIPMANGIGLNKPIGLYDPENVRKAEIDGKAFDGFIWSAWLGAAFQFDLAAVLNGDWNHVVFRAYNELRYSAYSRAGSGDSWVYINDMGENRNGWNWYGNFVLGYQMPLSPVLDMLGFMSEVNVNLYNTPGGDFWGDKLGRWIFTGFLNFGFTPKLSSTLALQMRTLRNHGSSDLENWDRYWYQDMELQHDYGSRRIVFYRVALILNYKLW